MLQSQEAFLRTELAPDAGGHAQGVDEEAAYAAMLSGSDFGRLNDIQQEIAKLKKLRDKYQRRVAAAEKEKKDVAKQVQRVPPSILRKKQLWTCEGVVDEVVEVDMSDRKQSEARPSPTKRMMIDDD